MAFSVFYKTERKEAQKYFSLSTLISSDEPDKIVELRSALRNIQDAYQFAGPKMESMRASILDLLALLS